MEKRAVEERDEKAAMHKQLDDLRSVSTDARRDADDAIREAEHAAQEAVRKGDAADDAQGRTEGLSVGYQGLITRRRAIRSTGDRALGAVRGVSRSNLRGIPRRRGAIRSRRGRRARNRSPRFARALSTRDRRGIQI